MTRNLKDFNRSELRRLGLLLQDPDECLLRLAHAGAALPATALELIALDAAREGQVLEVMPMLKRERLFRYGAWVWAQAQKR